MDGYKECSSPTVMEGFTKNWEPQRQWDTEERKRMGEKIGTKAQRKEKK